MNDVRLGLALLLVGGALHAVAGAPTGTAAPVADEAVHAGTQVFTVAPDGDDANPGTAARPWRTISHAATVAGPGSVVDVRGGTYNERVRVRVSGAPGAPIVFRAHRGEHVRISGRGLSGFRWSVGLIDVRNQHDLEFRGFELANFKVPDMSFEPAGVFVNGTSSDLSFRDLDIHDIAATGNPANAHGIHVVGTSGTVPASDIVVAHDHLHDLTLGSSEAITFSGNVVDWKVVDNTIEHVNNIGIDIQGGYHSAPANDRARRGLVARNTIVGVDRSTNPVYPAGRRFAGAVYVDGGSRVVVESNRISDSDIGVELASENPGRSTSDIVLRDNVVSDSYVAGLCVGGYDPQRGTATRLEIANNTFVGNDAGAGTGELVLNWGLSHATFTDNVFGASGARVVSSPYDGNHDLAFTGNLWYGEGRSAAQARFAWEGDDLAGYDAWRRRSGETQGRYGEPAA